MLKQSTCSLKQHQQQQKKKTLSDANASLHQLRQTTIWTVNSASKSFSELILKDANGSKVNTITSLP